MTAGLVPIRRVVTGNDENGKSKVVWDGPAPNAQPASMAAMIATLTELAKEETFATLKRQGNRLMQGIKQALNEADIQARVQGFPQIFHVAFGADAEITDYRSSLKVDKARYVKFTSALHYHGVRALERGAWFISTTHNDEVIDATIEAVAAVAKEI